MRIPQIVAQTEISQPPMVRASGEALAAPYVAAQRFAQTAQHAALQIAEVERLKYAQGVKIETRQLESQMELEVGTLHQNLKMTVADPDEFLQRYDAGVKEIKQKVSALAKYPESRAALTANVLKSQTLAAQGSANELYIGLNVGKLHETLANRRITMGLLDPTDEEAWVREYAKGVRDIENAVTLVSPKAAVDMRLKWRSDVAYQRGEDAIKRDPENTDISRLQPLMTPESWDRLEAKQTAAKKSATVEWEKFYARIEKDAEAERRGLLTEATAQAEAGTLTVARLEDLRIMRVITSPAEYRVLHKAVTEVKDEPSHPDVLRRVDLAVHQQVPTISEGQVDALLGRGLNRKDWKEAKEKLIGRRTALANEEQAQAEQLLRAAVGKGPMDRYDDEDGQLFNTFLKQLSARSNAFPEYGGKESPLAVAQDLSERIKILREPRLRLEHQKLGQTLRFRAPDSASAAESLKKAVERGLIDPRSNEYTIQQRIILDMQRREEGLGPARSGGQSQSGGGARPLRPPGTKARTGTAED